MKELEKLNQLTESHGALRPGKGGHKLPVNDFADDTPYIGPDWFILDLPGSTLIFIFIEKLLVGFVQLGPLFLDHLFVPNGFFKQLAAPFRWKE